MPTPPSSNRHPAASLGLVLGLGLDAGGSATRWALAHASGRVVAEGEGAAVSGSPWAQGGAAQQQGAAELQALVQAACAALPPGATLAGLRAGITGLAEEHRHAIAATLGQAAGLHAAPCVVGNDIELVCHAAFAPGGGIVVYAGTGSIAAHIDSSGTLHRAGGRGPVIDDAGSGHWLGRQALRAVWRAEDTQPGSGSSSPLGQALAVRLGGSGWAEARAFIVNANRGQVGLLALAVADAAQQGDAIAAALLHAAGTELARLAKALQQRLATEAEPMPVALAGRVWQLHPAIEAAFHTAIRADRPNRPNVQTKRLVLSPHHAAAVLAAGGRPC